MAKATNENAKSLPMQKAPQFKGKKVTNDRQVGTCGGAFKKGENARPTE